MVGEKNAANPRLYYTLVDTLKQLAEDGEDVQRLTQHALRQVQRKVYSYDRTAYSAHKGTEVGLKWAKTFERALKKLGVRIDKLDSARAGNVRTEIRAKLNGVDIPLIVISDERKSNRYSVLKWARIDTGSNAKFINAPTKMAQYVIDTYLGDKV